MEVAGKVKHLAARAEAAVHDCIENHIQQSWFAPVFWAVLACSAATALHLLRILSLTRVLLSVPVGALFGLWLSRADAGLSPMATRLEAKASAGDPVACRQLAQAYLKGAPGLPSSPEVARKWLLAAAERGDRQAMVQLADFLRWGIGGVKDTEGAGTWEARAKSTAGYRAALNPRTP